MLTYQPNPAASPLPAALAATNVTVTDVSIIDSVVSTTTDAAGMFTLGNIPAGIHSLVFSGAGWATLRVDGISVLATKATVVNKLLPASNPIVTVPVAASAPAGFNAQATLGVTVSGGTPPYTYRWVAALSNPTAVTLSSSSAAAPTFTTGSLAAVIAGNKAVALGRVSTFDANGVMSYGPDPQLGFLGISAQQLLQLTYNFTVTVTDATGFVKSATVAVPPATLAQGNGVVPLGQTVVANLPGNSTIATFTRPGGSVATLNEAGTANPWFIPDVQGNYSLTAGGSVLQVNANSFTSASPSWQPLLQVHALRRHRRAGLELRRERCFDPGAHRQPDGLLEPAGRDDHLRVRDDRRRGDALQRLVCRLPHHRLQLARQQRWLR